MRSLIAKFIILVLSAADLHSLFKWFWLHQSKKIENRRTKAEHKKKPTTTNGEEKKFTVSRLMRGLYDIPTIKFTRSEYIASSYLEIQFSSHTQMDNNLKKKKELFFIM